MDELKGIMVRNIGQYSQIEVKRNNFSFHPHKIILV